MSIAVRSYKYPDDFELVGEFLVKTYQLAAADRQQRGGFTNGEVIPCEKYKYYFNINI